MLLFRHILIELVKVLAVTTSVLVTVIAFGAAVKPLAENLLGPADLLRYMAYATVPMLQFALPFSAAFAGVVVYHRMNADNEILAMAVSGIPYRRILRPALALGILLTLVMVFLLDVLAPQFWRSLKQIAGEDVSRVFVSLVDRGEAIEFRGHEIYADEAYVEEAPPDTGASQRLRLVGVTALELDGPKGNRVSTREFTAQYATADIYRIGDNTHVKIVLQDATVFTKGDQAIAGARIVRPETIDLGQSLAAESPKGLRTSELLAIRARPESWPEVEGRRRTVLAFVDLVDAWRTLAARSAGGAPVTLTGVDLGSERPVTYEIENARLVGAALEPADRRPDGMIVIRLRDADGGVRRSFAAPGATLSHAPGLRFNLVAEGTVPLDAGGSASPRALRLTDLAVPELEVLERDLPNAELVAAARAKVQGLAAGPTEELRQSVTKSVDELIDKEQSVRRDALARITQRAAQSLTALLMVLSASILAILFRDRPPLLVYSLAFVPSIIDILLISSGEQMLRASTSTLGFVTVVSGNLVLVAICAVGAWRVGQH